jgi:hypothetical protein
MDKTAQPWTVPVALDDIPETGLHLEIEAPAEARAALARLAELRELPELKAAFDLTKAGAGVHVVGTVAARVGQTCVVTLEPIENQVQEAVDLRFAPAAVPAAAAGEPEPAKGEGEPPEPLVDGVLDLGAVATEFLLLGIDPYPRKQGATFTAPAGTEEGAKPFAGLAALKNRLGRGQG